MTVRYHTRNWATISTPEGEFETDSRPVDADEILIEVVGKKAIIGYLVTDEDARNPLEEFDGYGHIYSSHRDRFKQEHANMQEALGLNSDWEPNIEEFEDEATEFLIEAAIRSAMHRRSPNFVSIEFYHAPSSGTVTVAYARTKKTFDYELRYWAADGTYHPYITFRGEELEIGDWEDVAKNMWLEGRKNGTIGNKYAVSLDVYEHSGVSYSVSGTSLHAHDMWDTARGGAVWVPGKNELEDIESHPEDKRHERAEELAKQACEVYTDWANGWVYGGVIEGFIDESEDEEGDEYEPKWVQSDEVANDSCFGFYGWDLAIESLKEMMAEAKGKL